MSRSAVRVCRENGWAVGDVLESDDGHGADRIRITAMGESAILVRKIQSHGETRRGAAEYAMHLDLSGREWRRVPR